MYSIAENECSAARAIDSTRTRSVGRRALRRILVAAAGLCLAILVAVLVAVDRPIQLPKGYVPYDQAVSVLCSGQVKTLGQTHQRLVVLDLKNGTTIRTIEPQIDMVFHECANCRDACQGITYWTE